MVNETSTSCKVKRLSSDKQTDGESLHEQDLMLKLLESNLNTVCTKEYEVVYSATSQDYSDQPFAHIIDDIKQNHLGEFKYMLVAKVDRVTRAGISMFDKIDEELKELGITLLDAEGFIQNREINTLAHLGLKKEYKWAMENPSRKALVLKTEEALSEGKVIKRRMIGAEINYTQMGYWMREAPYGLKLIEVYTNAGKRKILANGDNEEYKFLRLMQDLGLKGNLSHKEVVDIVNENGYTSRTFLRHDKHNKRQLIGKGGGKKLTVEKLKKIYSQYVYAGINCEIWTNNIPIKAQFAGTITIDDYNKLNEGRVFIEKKLDGTYEIHKGVKMLTKMPKNKRNPLYPYKDQIVCPTCGGSLLGSASKGKYKYYEAYHCSRGHKLFRILRKDVHELVDKFCNSVEFTAEFKEKLLETIRAEWLKREELHTDIALRKNEEILRIDSEIKKLLNDFKNTDSKTVKDLLEKDIEELQTKKQSIQLDRNKNDTEQLNMEKILYHARYYMEHLQELLTTPEDPFIRASLFGLLFEEVPTYFQLKDGTPRLASMVKLNESYKNSPTSMVTPRGIEPLLPG